MLRHLSIRRGVPVGWLFACAQLTAQTSTTPITPTFATAVSTGMVGLAATQTAQLNVVNLTTTSSTITVSFPCEVQLEFWDSTGKMLKSLPIASLAPGTAGSLQIKLPDVTSNTSPLRTEIRGVLRSNPLPASGQEGPVLPSVLPASCTIATTLEVFDNATGVTQSLTSDLHAMQTIGVVPVVMAAH
jgi:hypothetical protein